MLKVKVYVSSQTILIPISEGEQTTKLVEAFQADSGNKNYDALAEWFRDDIAYDLEFEIEDMEVIG